MAAARHEEAEQGTEDVLASLPYPALLSTERVRRSTVRITFPIASIW